MTTTSEKTKCHLEHSLCLELKINKNRIYIAREPLLKMRMLDIGLHESYEKYLENVVETVWASSVCGFFFLLLEKKQEGKKKEVLHQQLTEFLTVTIW